jgi:hypothetical protein
MAVSTKPGGTEPARVFSMGDVGVLVGVPLLIGLAWLLPENYWPSVGQVLSPLAISGLTPDREATLGSIRRTRDPRLPATGARKIPKSMASEGILSFFQVLKRYRFDRWTPAVRIANVERVEQARQSGRGVILWVAHAFHGHLAARVAFRRAGLSVSHLSQPTHGFSSTLSGGRAGGARSGRETYRCIYVAGTMTSAKPAHRN